MIQIDSRKRLKERRDALYKHLSQIINTASVEEIESIMRKIHMINTKIISQDI